MTYSDDRITHSDLMRITGLRSDALRFFADRGVIVPDPETNKQGRGIHRRYHLQEAIFALIGRELNDMSVPAKDIVRVRNGILLFLGWCQSVARWPTPINTFAIAPSEDEQLRVFHDYLFSLALISNEPVIMLIDRDRKEYVRVILHLFRDLEASGGPDVVLGGAALPKPVLFARSWFTTKIEEKIEKDKTLRAAEMLRLDRVLAPARHLFV